MQENTMKACIRAIAPYLSCPLNWTTYRRFTSMYRSMYCTIKSAQESGLDHGIDHCNLPLAQASLRRYQ